ncbi:unnamed protein product [Acanthoscelides obtectus]|uniref:Uncharacterized protein n=2 Tax=Acanthoscelides obtectus TaxID=200917 RepID=A0A9P0LF00_ACAOB|nr:unnamed protein product [Acanthoscelides obtectus]CAK1635642.1 hypothetical protein AOBTE_LOCUS9412 [Acanthoscelides obtectus]
MDTDKKITPKAYARRVHHPLEDRLLPFSAYCGTLDLRIMKILFYVALILSAMAAYVQACISNGGACQADGSLGNCCSGFCYQQAGWAEGYCKNR